MDWREIFIRYACYVNFCEGTDFLHGDNDFIKEECPNEFKEELIKAIEEAHQRQRM